MGVETTRLKTGRGCAAAGRDFSDDQVEDEEGRDDPEADVNHKSPIVPAGPDHRVQPVDRSSKKTAENMVNSTFRLPINN